MGNSKKAINTDISNFIYTFRGKQIMLDSDLAVLYKVETKVLNQAVKRNIDRFPKKYMFQLTDEEFDDLRSQFVTSSFKENYGGRRYNPFVFTEQGIAMLSAVLKSDTAVGISIRIMDAFVEMRKFLVNNQDMFSRIARVELKQLESDKKLEEVFNCIAKNEEVTQKIFFEGQIYDAYSFISDLIKKAKTKLVLIDNYVDIKTLNVLCKKTEGVEILILTAGKGGLSSEDV